MCGRYGALDSERITQFARNLGATDFMIEHNPDIRPTNRVPVIIAGMQTQHVTWGIQPAWAKKILINAQGETVATKKTFAAAFRDHRCLIPLDCWYEWRDEGGRRKQKYRFQLPDGGPMLMAGIWYPGDEPAMVSLTTTPNAESAEIHNRMPATIAPEHAGLWIEGEPNDALTLLFPIPNNTLTITPYPSAHSQV